MAICFASGVLCHGGHQSKSERQRQKSILAAEVLGAKYFDAFNLWLVVIYVVLTYRHFIARKQAYRGQKSQ
jgi:hypothetical protein